MLTNITPVSPQQFLEAIYRLLAATEAYVWLTLYWQHFHMIWLPKLKISRIDYFIFFQVGGHRSVWLIPVVPDRNIRTTLWSACDFWYIDMTEDSSQSSGGDTAQKTEENYDFRKYILKKDTLPKWNLQRFIELRDSIDAKLEDLVQQERYVVLCTDFWNIRKSKKSFWRVGKTF